MDHTVVVPGVGRGGMTDKYQVKILICYLMSAVSAPFTADQLNEIFQDTQIVNYFTFCEALDELKEGGQMCIRDRGNTHAYITLPEIKPSKTSSGAAIFITPLTKNHKFCRRRPREFPGAERLSSFHMPLYPPTAFRHRPPPRFHPLRKATFRARRKKQHLSFHTPEWEPYE